MRTFLSLGLAVLFVLSLTSGVSAIPVGGTFDFSDTVIPSGSPGRGWSWTHTLEASFTPPLDGTEPGLNFTSGTLTTIGDYILAPNSPDVVFYCFLQRAYGDSIFLGSLFLDQNSPGVEQQGQGAYIAFDYQWDITLNQDALSALEDRIFGVRFEVVFPPEALIRSIASSTLSGSGSVVPISHTPEPATMLLVGAGLLGLAGLGRKKFFKKG